MKQALLLHLSGDILVFAASVVLALDIARRLRELRAKKGFLILLRSIQETGRKDLIFYVDGERLRLFEQAPDEAFAVAALRTAKFGIALLTVGSTCLIAANLLDLLL